MPVPHVEYVIVRFKEHWANVYVYTLCMYVL